MVQMGQGLDEMAIKQRLLAARSCKCMNMLLETNTAEGNHEPTELKASIQQARSELAPGALLPPHILLQLCELRWSTDQVIGWQQEWARRQEACQAAASALEVRVLTPIQEVDDASHQPAGVLVYTRRCAPRTVKTTVHVADSRSKHCGNQGEV